jgi:hypothetical protein
MQPELVVKGFVLLAVANGTPMIAKRLLGEAFFLSAGRWQNLR